MQIFIGLQNTDFEQALIPKDPTLITALLLEQRPTGAGEYMEIWLTVSTLGLQMHPGVISVIPKHIIKVDVFGSWINNSVSCLWKKSYYEDGQMETSQTMVPG